MCLAPPVQARVASSTQLNEWWDKQTKVPFQTSPEEERGPLYSRTTCQSYSFTWWTPGVSSNITLMKSSSFKMFWVGKFSLVRSSFALKKAKSTNKKCIDAQNLDKDYMALSLFWKLTTQDWPKGLWGTTGTHFKISCVKVVLTVFVTLSEIAHDKTKTIFFCYCILFINTKLSTFLILAVCRTSVPYEPNNSLAHRRLPKHQW